MVKLTSLIKQTHSCVANVHITPSKTVVILPVSTSYQYYPSFESCIAHSGGVANHSAAVCATKNMHAIANISTTVVPIRDGMQFDKVSQVIMKIVHKSTCSHVSEE